MGMVIHSSNEYMYMREWQSIFLWNVLVINDAYKKENIE